MRVYRASSLGYSLCSLVCGELGYQPIDPPEWLQAKFDEGTALEPIVLEKLRTREWIVDDEQAELNDIGDYQHEFYLEVIPGIAQVRGHIDAKGTNTLDLNCVIEVKSTNDKYFDVIQEKGWDAGGLIEKYKWQISVYQLATGLPVALVWCRKSDQKLYIMWAMEPFYTISDIALKLQQAEDHIAEGKIPEGCTDYPCPYFYLHGGNDSAPPEPADPELDALLSAWMVADKAKKAYEGEAKALRELIVEYAGETIAGKIKGSQGVTVSTVYQEESEWVSKRSAGWVTKVSAPRKGRNVTE